MSTQSLKIPAVVVGGTGFSALEMLRLLHSHPRLEISQVVSSSKAGSIISDTHKSLKGVVEGRFVGEVDFSSLEAAGKSVIFCCLPHGVSAKWISDHWEEAQKAQALIVDLSGDLRLQDRELVKQHYPTSMEHEFLLDEFTYGLCELNQKQIKGAKAISNPGCYATTCALAVAPLAASSMLESVIFDAKSGSSGAGKSPSELQLHSVRNGSFLAYKVLEHRHEPEIAQTLEYIGGDKVDTSFIPHLLPISRGIYANAYPVLKPEFRNEISDDDLKVLYEKFFASCHFVQVCDEPPELSSIVGSNYVQIFVKKRGDRIIIISTLDNLVKGASGQALQNVNLVFGWEESLGLDAPGLALV